MLLKVYCEKKSAAVTIEDFIWRTKERIFETACKAARAVCF